MTVSENGGPITWSWLSWVDDDSFQSWMVFQVVLEPTIRLSPGRTIVKQFCHVGLVAAGSNAEKTLPRGNGGEKPATVPRALLDGRAL